jgi:hypothetical protein
MITELICHDMKIKNKNRIQLKLNKNKNKKNINKFTKASRRRKTRS